MGILFAADSNTRAIKQEQLYSFSSAKVTKEMIRNNTEKYVLKSNGYVENYLDKGNLLDDSTLVYLQWNGYADGLW